jgi:hypothetical protein
MDMQTDVLAAPIPAPIPAPSETLLSFEASGHPIHIEMTNIPQDVRTGLLKSAIQAYVMNRVSTNQSINKKKNELFAQYAAANAADPLQTAVPKPEGEPVPFDVVAFANSAINDLFTGNYKKRAAKGEKKVKERKDPLIAAVTRAVTAEVFRNNTAGIDRPAIPGYRYPDAIKEVGADGVQYLRNMIALKVKQGANAKELNDYLETKYLKPARIMLGLEAVAPRFKDMAGIL